MAVNGKSKARADHPGLASPGPVAAVSFGVGGREAKRLGGRFEDDLLELLRQEGYRIILDYGAGDDEERLTDERVGAFTGSVATLDEFTDWLEGSGESQHLEGVAQRVWTLGGRSKCIHWVRLRRRALGRSVGRTRDRGFCGSAFRSDAQALDA